MQTLMTSATVPSPTYQRGYLEKAYRMSGEPALSTKSEVSNHTANTEWIVAKLYMVAIIESQDNLHFSVFSFFTESECRVNIWCWFCEAMTLTYDPRSENSWTGKYA